MDERTRADLDNLHAPEGSVRYDALMRLLAATEAPVGWAYEVWEGLVADLGHRDPHRRAVAAQLLSRLARSDPERRIFRDWDALLALTRDPRFVTARHSLQSLWRVGLAGEEQRALVLSALAGRFAESGGEKNGTLIRYDIVQSLRHLYDATGDETIRNSALALIEEEADMKYRKKYATVWR